MLLTFSIVCCAGCGWMWLDVADGIGIAVWYEARKIALSSKDYVIGGLSKHQETPHRDQHHLPASAAAPNKEPMKEECVSILSEAFLLRFRSSNPGLIESKCGRFFIILARFKTDVRSHQKCSTTFCLIRDVKSNHLSVVFYLDPRAPAMANVIRAQYTKPISMETRERQRSKMLWRPSRALVLWSNVVTAHRTYEYEWGAHKSISSTATGTLGWNANIYSNKCICTFRGRKRLAITAHKEHWRFCRQNETPKKKKKNKNHFNRPMVNDAVDLDTERWWARARWCSSSFVFIICWGRTCLLFRF